MLSGPGSPRLLLLFLLLSACATESAPPEPRAILGRDHPVFSALLTVAGGEHFHETHGTSLDGDTTAGFYRLQVEGNSNEGFGGGLDIEAMGSDNDLFSAIEPTRATWAEFSPYFLYRVQQGKRFRMPMRMGIYFQDLELEGQTSGAKVEWETVGLRFAIEPEYVFHRRHEFEASIAGELILGFGGTNVRASGGGSPTQRFDTGAGLFGFEFGPRVRFGAFTAGISFLHRTIAAAESDPSGRFVANGIDAGFTGLAATVGVRF